MNGSVYNIGSFLNLIYYALSGRLISSYFQTNFFPILYPVFYKIDQPFGFEDLHQLIG
jgi:hypothetical protein